MESPTNKDVVRNNAPIDVTSKDTAPVAASRLPGLAGLPDAATESEFLETISKNPDPSLILFPPLH